MYNLFDRCFANALNIECKGCEIFTKYFEFYFFQPDHTSFV